MGEQPDIGITGLDGVSRSALAKWVLDNINECKALREEAGQQRTRAQAAEAELREMRKDRDAALLILPAGCGSLADAANTLRQESDSLETANQQLRKALAPAAGQPHRFVAVVGACSDRVDFTRLIRVVGPFDTAEAAKASGEIECGRHQPDTARDDEVSIEFEVVAWQEVSRG